MADGLEFSQKNPSQTLMNLQTTVYNGIWFSTDLYIMYSTRSIRNTQDTFSYSEPVL